MDGEKQGHLSRFCVIFFERDNTEFNSDNANFLNMCIR